jgi:hypothetical protein
MTLVNRRVVQELCLILTGLFAIFWAILRASVQAITIDEAFTYLYFVAQPLSAVWEPNSNNHVLHSLLMWIATHILGTSNISVRTPALLGAILYIVVCYFLCKSITEQFSLRLALFVCLTYNPFIFDYMVAARGYGLADAFLLAALAVPVWHRVKGRPPLRVSCALASLALGLSFTANFSFAFVDLAAFLAIGTWAIRRREGDSIASVAGFSVVPGLLVVLLLGGYPLANWREGDLWWGAHSLREMRLSLTQASFYQLDPRFRESGWYGVMDFLRPRFLRYLAILCCVQVVATRLDGSWLQDDRSRWLGRFAAALAGIAALSVTISWLAFRFYHLPLPLGRTGIFLIPLCTLVAGVIGAAPARSLVSQWVRHGITAVLICMACYFLLCLRLSYFREYQVDADVKDVYSILARFNHTYGVADVEVTGLYVSSLNYYRALSKRETFPKFELKVPELTAGKPIYVLSGAIWREFIEKEGLMTVYRGNFSDVVVAVRPGGIIPARIVKP